MIMAFFIIFSYATNFFNIFSCWQLKDFGVIPIVVLQDPGKYLEGLHLHSLKILVKCLAMVWNCQANRLSDLLHQLRTQIDRVVDGINQVNSVLISAV
jgi:hypothetical protein